MQRRTHICFHSLAGRHYQGKNHETKKMDLNQISGNETSVELYYFYFGNPFMHLHCLLYHFPQPLFQILSTTSPTFCRTSHLMPPQKCFAQFSLFRLFTLHFSSFSKISVTQILFFLLFIPNLSKGQPIFSATTVLFLPL